MTTIETLKKALEDMAHVSDVCFGESEDPEYEDHIMRFSAKNRNFGIQIPVRGAFSQVSLIEYKQGAMPKFYGAASYECIVGQILMMGY